MSYSFEGDPRLILTVDGSKLNFVNGQPTMDQGLENMALIRLFTSPGWPGNALLPVNEQIGSDFEMSTRAAINLDTLNRIEDAAKRALIDPVFGDVTVEVSNPVHFRIDVKITIQPPVQDIKVLLVQKNGLNWLAQILTPASERI